MIEEKGPWIVVPILTLGKSWKRSFGKTTRCYAFLILFSSSLCNSILSWLVYLMRSKSKRRKWETRMWFEAALRNRIKCVCKRVARVRTEKNPLFSTREKILHLWNAVVKMLFLVILWEDIVLRYNGVFKKISLEDILLFSDDHIDGVLASRRYFKQRRAFYFVLSQSSA